MDGQVKQIVMRQIAALADDPRIYAGIEVDESAWVDLVIERMQVEERLAHKAVLYEAPKDFYSACVKEFIRRTREPAGSEIREVRESMRRAKRQNTIAKLVIDGKIVAKRYIELTPAEALALAADYRKQGGAMLRKAAQYEADANRAIQLGLALDKPFSALFTEAELAGSADDVSAVG